MYLVKSIFTTALCSVLIMNLPLVASAEPTTHTAEYNLVRSVNALAGENLDAATAKSALAADLTQYQQNQIKDGAQDTRFVQALVDNHVYAADQANALFADAMNSSKVAATSGATDAIITQQMTELAQTHLTGGQFSACGAAGGTLLAAGIGAVIAGAIFTNEGTSCAGFGGPSGTVGGCAANGNGPGNPTLDRDLFIGGAIGIAAGVVFLITSAASGC